jgi:xanthine dehydrogenase YagR molybdenum-binding subunit
MLFSEFVELIEAEQPGGITRDPQPDPQFSQLSSIIGAALPRIDGPLKTSGTATYAADYHFPNMAYAVPVTATIASGTIVSIDKTAAAKMPGVVLILDHSNIGPLFRVTKGGRNSEARTPFEDEKVYYWGQYVACVVADSLQQAKAAADAVVVNYKEDKHNVSMKLDDELPGAPRSMSKRGDTTAAFAAAPVKIDYTYSTPVETHNPMEMHATTAVWDGKRYTLYESSQGVVNHQAVMAQVLGVEPADLKVISRFIGSGFGGKLFPWPHSALAAVASRQLNRPVKLMVSRKMMFANVGHRPSTEQRIRLSATTDGKLLSLEQNYRNHTSILDDIRENCGEATPFLYSTANLQVTSALVRRNVGAPTPMRGPGAVPGLFALESGIDELAVALKIDPVKLRLGLDTTMDGESKKPFSSRHLKECLEVGAERFGWSKRNPEVGSMRKGDLILGWGVGCASWGAGRGGAQCSVSLLDDGTVKVSSATQDIGTGTYTVMAQVASDKTGIPISRINVVLGDSSAVPGPMSGGSTATATIIPAVADAANLAVKALLDAATKASGAFNGKDASALTMTKGRVHLKGTAPETGVAFAEVLKTAGLPKVDGAGKTGPRGAEARDYSFHSFGAQFVEVEYDPGIAKIRVSRVTSVIDAGRMINTRTATNQMAGAIVMGVGMALLEQTIYDPRNGHAINDNFADYVVPTSADTPKIDVHFLEIPDPLMGEYGARGVGEIGLAGIAPAIASAVYHATGVRVRSLPIRVEDILTSKVLV